ncbi:MAG: PAS domain-containing protein [Chloroflexi bacterium]|nr:PAS domain-containing protein [Chloroflexota bacterium]
MTDHLWIKEFPGSITVCDADGLILSMNDKSVKTFESQGGAELIGTSLLDCHPEPARAKLQHLLDARQANVYTIEKNGVHRLIYQSPWYEQGKYRGLIELSLEIPIEMPHFIRAS